MARFELMTTAAVLLAIGACAAAQGPVPGAAPAAPDALAAWERTQATLRQMQYPNSGTPLFALDSANAKAVQIGGLLRRRATPDAVVFDTVRPPAKGGEAITAVLFRDESRLQGTDSEGRLRLFAPSELQPGSSISHWDVSAFPNLLMEPSISRDLDAFEVDVTPRQLFDIGWLPGTSSFRVVSGDGPGEGLDDGTAFSGAPGNDATTLGQARRNVIEAALAVWGDILSSPVPIEVIVNYAEQSCGDEGVTLAGATSLFQFSTDEAGGDLPLDNVLYPGPLAEAIVGIDLTGPPEADGGDIVITVNSAVDEGCAGAGTAYYYGLDGNEGNRQFDFLAVMLHELAHGLGFQTFASLFSGATRDGIPSVYDLFAFDLTLDKSWAEMTAAERRFSTTNDGNVVWTGPEVVLGAAGLLEPGVPVLTVDGSQGADGSFEPAFGTIGSGVPEAPLAAPAACLADAFEERVDGCEPSTEDLRGRIAFVRRGNCLFTTKASNAQNAGASALFIVNNEGDSGVAPGGDPTVPIAIPVAGIGRSEGEPILAELCDIETPNRRVEPFLAVDSGLACPGFYIGEVEAIDSDGRWDMEILLTAGRRLLQGGLNLGGGFEGAARPGFAAFNIANDANEPQAVDIALTVDKPEGLRWRLEIERRDGSFAVTIFSVDDTSDALQVTEVLEPGFYVVRVFGLGLVVPSSRFNLALETRFIDRPGGAFQGGVNLGGVMSGTSAFGTDIGFGAFCLDEAQSVSFETSGLDAADGAANLRLRVLDADRNVLSELP